MTPREREIADIKARLADAARLAARSERQILDDDFRARLAARYARDTEYVQRINARHLNTYMEYQRAWYNRRAAEQPAHIGPVTSTAAAYQVLGLPPGASYADVRAAYRALALSHHPDRPNGNIAEMIRLNAAHELLKAAL